MEEMPARVTVVYHSFLGFLVASAAAAATAIPPPPLARPPRRPPLLPDPSACPRSPAAAAAALLRAGRHSHLASRRAASRIASPPALARSLVSCVYPATAHIHIRACTAKRSIQEIHQLRVSLARRRRRSPPPPLPRSASPRAPLPSMDSPGYFTIYGGTAPPAAPIQSRPPTPAGCYPLSPPAPPPQQPQGGGGRRNRRGGGRRRLQQQRAQDAGGAPHYQQALPAGHQAFIGAPLQPIGAGYGALLAPPPLGGYGPTV
nr:atherin-like [Aegilops tauschii subsp. strangulata]